VDVEDHVGPRDDEVLVAAFEVRAAEIVSREVVALYRGPRGPVEDEDAFGQRLFQKLRSFLSLVHNKTGSGAGRRAVCPRPVNKSTSTNRRRLTGISRSTPADH
jgi:hypothetical protein